MRIPAPLIAGAVLAACTGSSTPAPPDDPGASGTTVYLSPTQHLTRASLALRGIRPSIEDLRAVEEDPAALPGIVDRYLASPELAETMQELHNETLLLRVEQGFLTFPAIGGLTGATAARINGAVFDEPLRLIADIVASDQPYTKLVTADYTMADGAVAEIWGLPHAGPYDAWERTRWTDGRGAAGVLATSVLYHRYRSTGFNYNRGRANLISSAFLCHDFLESDIQIDATVDLSDPDVVANAVVANQSCAGCHQAMDPLASYLFPFRGQIGVGNITAYPVPHFQASAANRWQVTNKRPPMYFGQQVSGLAGLGRAIADDPRFARCAAQRFASYLTEVPQRALPGAWIARLQKDFVAGGFSAKQLAKAIVLSDEFRVSHDPDAAAAEGLVGVQKLRPEQLSRVLRDLTGFVWTTRSNIPLRGIPYGQADLLASDFIGFRVLAGGIDSYFVTEPVHTVNATSSLVAHNAAAAAADFVVERDAAAPASGRTLFVMASVDDTAEPAVRAELAHLHARIYGELVEPMSPEVDETYQLWQDALAKAGAARRAWKVTLIGMLSDFRSLFY
ncbi:MAG TPA: DUF1585 domain-containing protein [Kofleriaceae bacterium]|nr:DUF1585 domain-containing protein [Kofleriaceae bacterium]